ncbi:glycosyltransferase family 2 protein [Enterococcus caccae]|uniref:Glycosyl transferase, group 2 family protein n=1 Tax=Enterococcus caccae ATCC BAA-1240 TaxID=1158612 RepID=R3U0Z4_9ENTE|nr:glycosyltransferase family 2 protein [Enterococcus caccae]EOL47494.1 glycosyl transferase, group 2 family protein [Enterococcus caccae ATCC BAA-1240]EOT65701.1 glycosyl transferase, group 2 family protein [Enterococcus caccae ATCC BAA-1240]OJG23174.1 glycosyl transferase, group 2 family protein [Enterococcus caccae]
MNDRITISIVTHNSRHIFDVLDNLKQELGLESSYDIHIFDNASDQSYIDKLESYGPFISLHKAEENEGFGHGHNEVIKKITTRYAVIFNPDILLKKHMLDEMIRRMKESDQLAAVCPKVLNSDGTTQYLVRQKLDLFDYILRFIPFQSIKKLFDKRLSYYECRDLPDDQTSYIKMGSGCFMVIDVEKFRHVGGFDERFFMYFEDNDLCLKFGKAGYKILYTPFDTVIHLYEKGAHKNKELFKIFLQSMVKFFNKWGWRFF